MSCYPEIQEAVDSIEVIDTHEHLEEEPTRLARPLDFSSLFTLYSNSDLMVSGLPDADWERIADPSTDPDLKWRLFEPAFQRCRNTAYIKSVLIAIRDLYDIDELTSETFELLTERMRERNRPGVLRWILRDKCRIDHCQVNASATLFRRPMDPDLFQQDINLAELLRGPPRVDLLEESTGVAVTRFEHYRDGIDGLFEQYAPMAAAAKQQAAYWRDLRFDDVTDDVAEIAFDQSMHKADEPDHSSHRRIQDWTYHRCIRNAIDHDLPLKIHTGYKAGQNAMTLAHIQPRDLNNLLLQYPQAKFSLFHIGYPYQHEVIALAKQFRNVYVDMCWSWIIDPQASRQFLKQFLTAVPANKLFGFGGDLQVAEPVYGHLKFARHGIARALTELVEEEYLSFDEAVTIAHRILHNNAAEVFRSAEKGAALRSAQSKTGS
jgi:predicted TIM-barrel fold metal-dependent hydrolase